MVCGLLPPSDELKADQCNSMQLKYKNALGELGVYTCWSKPSSEDVLVSVIVKISWLLQNQTVLRFSQFVVKLISYFLARVSGVTVCVAKQSMKELKQNVI